MYEVIFIVISDFFIFVIVVVLMLIFMRIILWFIALMSRFRLFFIVFTCFIVSMNHLAFWTIFDTDSINLLIFTIVSINFISFIAKISMNTLHPILLSSVFPFQDYCSSYLTILLLFLSTTANFRNSLLLTDIFFNLFIWMRLHYVWSFHWTSMHCFLGYRL